MTNEGFTFFPLDKLGAAFAEVQVPPLKHRTDTFVKLATYEAQSKLVLKYIYRFKPQAVHNQ